MKKLLFLILVLLSVSTIAQELYNDSTYYYTGAGWMWTYSGKEFVTERNDQMQVLEKVSYDKTPSTDFTPEYKTVFTYYPDGLTLETETRYAWRSDSSKWVISAYYDYQEDGQSNALYFKQFDFELNVFTSGYRYIKLYDGDDLYQRFYDTLDVENDAWLMYQKETNTYDAPGKLAERVTQVRDGSSWKNSTRMVNNYAGNDYPVQQFYYVYDDVNDVWDYTSRITFNPNDAGNPLYLILQQYNEGTWDDFLRYDYTYIDDTLLETRIFQSHYGSDWEREFQELYYYTETNQKDYVMKNAPYGSESWVNDEIIRYNYNEADQLTSRVEEYWDDSDWQDNIMYSRQYDEFGHLIYENEMHYVGGEMFDWQNDWGVEYFWVEEETTEIATKEQASVDCFPNPTTDYVNVVAQGNHQFELYDLSGLCVSQGEFNHSTQISLRDMPNGIYVLSVDGQANTKIIKQ